MNAPQDVRPSWGPSGSSVRRLKKDDVIRKINGDTDAGLVSHFVCVYVSGLGEFKVRGVTLLGIGAASQLGN